MCIHTCIYSIYIYPQAAWFAVSVNVYVGSFLGSSGGVRGGGWGGLNRPFACIFATRLRLKCYITSTFSGWKCYVASTFSGWKCYVTVIFAVLCSGGLEGLYQSRHICVCLSKYVNTYIYIYTCLHCHIWEHVPLWFSLITCLHRPWWVLNPVRSFCSVVTTRFRMI